MRDDLFARAASVAAFLLPAVALWLPSGYSYGALVLVLAALLGARRWLGQPVALPTWWLAGMIAAMALLWAADALEAPPGRALSHLDRAAKYLLALPCLFFVLRTPPRAAPLWAGIAVGAIGAGAIGLVQMYHLQWPRASGFTNAIQYGDLSLLLGLMASALLLVRWHHWRGWQRAGLLAGVLLGLEGALLSEARGGWLLLPVALPLAAWLQMRCGQRSLAWSGTLLLLAVALMLGGIKSNELTRRVAQVHEEVVQFQTEGDAQSSVGQRLAHWRLAFDMGLQRPWLGWGLAGYAAEKQRRVEAGLVHPFVLRFGHAHNELLDVFAKRGLLGVAVLLVAYAVPLVLFWPTRRRVLCARHGTPDTQALAIRLLGVLLPVAYMVFGITQAFFAHNSGNMFYVFMLIVLWGLLQAHERRRAAASAPQPGATPCTC